MNDHEIVRQVQAAQQDTRPADELIRQYLPFIKSETAKFLNRPPVEGRDDELGIAMFAFHEAVTAYRPARGAFLKLAAAAIRNRLIDFRRRESRHAHQISLDQPADGEECGRTLLEQLDIGHDNVAERHNRTAAQTEIREFAGQLASFGLTLTDIAENSPKQSRTLAACQQVLAYARRTPELLDELVTARKLPVAALAAGSGVERKTLERHRRYLVAVLLAYTNGYEIIRGHLRQMEPQKGGRV